MATPLCYQIHQGSDTTASGSTTAIGAGATVVIPIGQNQIFRLIASTPVNIRFGDSSLTTATANDVLVPANLPEFFDMGTNLSTIAIFAVAAASVNISIVSRT
jgi:hypothetical protein